MPRSVSSLIGEVNLLRWRQKKAKYIISEKMFPVDLLTIGEFTDYLAKVEAYLTGYYDTEYYAEKEELPIA